MATSIYEVELPDGRILEVEGDRMPSRREIGRFLVREKDQGGLTFAEAAGAAAEGVVDAVGNVVRGAKERLDPIVQQAYEARQREIEAETAAAPEVIATGLETVPGPATAMIVGATGYGLPAAAGMGGAAAALGKAAANVIRGANVSPIEPVIYGGIQAAGTLIPLAGTVGSRAFAAARPLTAMALQPAAGAVSGGVTGASLDALYQQAARGEIDWRQTLRSGGLAALFGGIAGGLRAAEVGQLAAQDRDLILQVARQEGFQGNTFKDLRKWYETERVNRMQRAAPAEEGASVPPTENLQLAGSQYAEGAAPVPTSRPAGLTPAAAPTDADFTAAAQAARAPLALPPATEALAPAAPAAIAPAAPASAGTETPPPPSAATAMAPSLPEGAPQRAAVEGSTGLEARASLPPPTEPVKPMSRRQMADMRRQIRELDGKAQRAAQTSPERAGEYTQQAQDLRQQLAQAEANRPRGVGPAVGLGADGNPDLLSDIAEYVGRIRTVEPEGANAQGGEYDGWNETLNEGAARLLRGRDRGMKPDEVVEILNNNGGYKFQSIGELQEAIRRAVAQRRKLGEQFQQEAYRNRVEDMARTSTRTGRRADLRPKDPTVIQNIGEGGSFTLNREKFSVVDIKDDPDNGETVYVIQDGHRFEVPHDTPIFADRDSIQPGRVETPVDPFDFPAPDQPAAGTPPRAPAPTQPAPEAAPLTPKQEIAALTAELGMADLGQQYTRPPELVQKLQRLGTLLLPGVRLQEAESLAQLHILQQRGEVTAAENAKYRNDLIKGGYVRMPDESQQEIAGSENAFNLTSEEQAPQPTAEEQRRAEAEARAEAARQGGLFDAGEEGAQSRGTGGIGDPLDPAMPPIPPGTASARINSARMPVAMERVAPGTRTTDIARVHEAMLSVIRAAGGDSAIRERRFYQRARGIAKSWEEVVRVDSLINIPTVAHEIGHVLSKNLFGSMQSRAIIAGINNGAVARDLQKLGKALYGSRQPAAGYTAEGFAELVRLWLTTEEAATKASVATTWFENTWMPANPQIAQAMRTARDEVDIWRSMSAQERARAQVKDEPGRLRRFSDYVKQQFSRKALLEQSAPLEVLAKAAEERLGAKLRPDTNPALVFQSVRQIAGATLETMIERGMLDTNGRIVGPPLREAYSLLRSADAENFRDYLVALEVIERVKQGKNNTGFNLEDVVYIRDKFSSDPRFVRAAEAVAEWNAGVLKYWRDAFPGQNDKLYRAIVLRNPKYYTPLARVLDPEKTKPGMATQASSSLARFKGSSLPVKQVIEQTLRGAENLIARAHRDMVMRSVVGLSKLEGMGFLLEPVPRQRAMQNISIEKIRGQLEAMGVDTQAIPEGEILSYAVQLDQPTGVDPIISLSIGGQTKWFQVPADVYEVLAGVQEPARLGMAFELLFGGPSRVFRLGTTGLRPAFSLFTNPARDLQTFHLQSVYGNPATRTAAYFSALRDIVMAGLTGKETPYIQLVHQLGLQDATFLGGDIAQIKREAKTLFRQNKWFRKVSTPVESMRELLSFTEGVPRLAEFMLALDDTGWKPGQQLSPSQIVAARLAWKRITTDFSARGSGWDVVRRGVPFFNAAIQGMRSMARATQTDQGARDVQKAWAKFVLNGIAVLTVPALIEYLNNKDEEWYNALPWKERFLYFNIPAGNQIIQIPKPLEWGVAFAVLPVALMESWEKKDPESANAAVAHAFQMANPLDWPVILNAVKEQWQNRVDFFDRPIVPRGELDLRPGSQAGRYTSALGRALGVAFPETISPRRFDAAVRAVAGGLGGDILDGPEAVMRNLGLNTRDSREWEPADMFVIGRGFRRGGPFTANNRHLFEFYDDLNRYRAMNASYNRALKVREEERARDGKVATPMPTDITARDRVYAAMLEVKYADIRASIDVAERAAAPEVRQKLYKRAGEIAASTLLLRPSER